MADETTPDANAVVAQKGKTVGETEARVVEPQVVKDTADAQVAPARDKESKTVNVHETYVQLDEVITDPSSPLAVQVPDAGRGSLDLPIHALNGPTVEQQFEDAAAEDESDE